ncbi:DUF4097 family beta strand repeat-containing protein [Neptunicella sp. SCSIO 80796]|uniref:DUF4097 family beta strand repeat-containing protein n=1 Tax=Neptunicella plasticusilytica TaxID=3117012 RepID=UPI003A4E1C9D
MKKWLSIVGLLSISMLVQAGEKVDKTIDAEKDGYVEIEHLAGSVNIKGWDKAQVRVVGELDERMEKFIFERDGNEVTIKVKIKKNRSWHNSGNEDGDKLDIYIPQQSQVHYTSVNADVKVENVIGSAEINVVNGDIKANKLAGRIHLESVNGNINADELAGDLKVETVNGDIKSRNDLGEHDSYQTVNGDIDIVSSSAEIKAETVNGDMELKLSKIKQLVLNTVNGDIEARLDLDKQGEVRGSSVSGDIELSFDKNVSARFDIQGHSGGKIVNDLTNDEPQKAKHGPNRWLEFSHNGGNGRVDVSTVSGKVKIGQY